MDAEIIEWVVYHPPKSVAFGHQSRIHDPRGAWSMTERFLTSLTELTLGHLVELTCYGPNSWTDTAVAMERITEARGIFGQEVNSSEIHPRWKISESQLQSAIQFALDDDKFPKQQMGPTRLHVYYRFLWNEFEKLPWQTNNTEPQDRMSRLGVIIGNKGSFLQPHFIFPAPWHSDFLRDFITKLEPIIPFRFRDQYFRRALLSVRGPRMRGRSLKLDKNWRGPIIPDPP